MEKQGESILSSLKRFFGRRTRLSDRGRFQKFDPVRIGCETGQDSDRDGERISDVPVPESSENRVPESGKGILEDLVERERRLSGFRDAVDKLSEGDTTCLCQNSRETELLQQPVDPVGPFINFFQQKDGILDRWKILCAYHGGKERKIPPHESAA